MAVKRVNGKEGRCFKLVNGQEVNIPIKGFDFEDSSALDDATTNVDGGFTNKTVGLRSAKGSITCLWDDLLQGQPCPTELQSGDEVRLHLYPSVGSGYWDIPAAIGSVPVKVTEGSTNGWTASFENQGAFAWVPGAR